MRAGQLRERVTIETVTQTADALGQMIETYPTSVVRNAAVKALSGSESFTGVERSGNVSWQFTFRLDSQTKLIGPEHRLTWDSKTFNVTSAISSDRRSVVVLARQHL